MFDQHNLSTIPSERSLTWINFNSKFFSLLPEPLNEVAESDDVVAVVMHRKALDNGNGDSTRGRQDGKLVFGDRSVERSSLLFPVRDELGEGRGLEASSGQNVASDRGRLFDDADAQLLLGLREKTTVNAYVKKTMLRIQDSFLKFL